MNDRELISQYVTGSQDAFRELVDRHIDMVYAAATRQVHDAELAKDVTQAVFIVLAKKARTLPRPEMLSGWLINATRYCASNARVAEARRRKHEQKAAAMTERRIATPADDVAEAIAPTLDDAMSGLGERDRTAVALRFFHDKSFSEVGAAMGISEEAARKRVERSVSKLRTFFSRQGIVTGGDVLAASLAPPRSSAPQGMSMLAADGALAALAAHSTATSPALIAHAAMQSMRLARYKLIGTWAAGVLLAVTVVMGIAVAVKPANSAAVVEQPTPPATKFAAVKVIRAPVPSQYWDGWRMSALPNPPGTAPPSPFEQFDAFLTPSGELPTFSGRVEGLSPGENAEVGIISMNGVPWVRLDNYEWSPVVSDGTFSIVAKNHPNAGKCIAVRSPTRPWTIVRKVFTPLQSAKNMVVYARAGKIVRITAAGPGDVAIKTFKAELFPEYEILADNGDPFGQQLGTFTTQKGELKIPLPLERIAIIVAANGMASFYQVIDPREADEFHIVLMRESRIEGAVTQGGQPAAGVSVRVVNRAAPLVSTVKTTDKNGHFTCERFSAGKTEFTIKGKSHFVELKPETVNEVKLDLN